MARPKKQSAKRYLREEVFGLEAMLMTAIRLLAVSRGLSCQGYLKVLICEDIGRVGGAAWSRVKKVFAPLLFSVLNLHQGRTVHSPIRWNPMLKRYEIALGLKGSNRRRSEQTKRMEQAALDDLATIEPQFASLLADRLLFFSFQKPGAKPVPTFPLEERVLECVRDQIRETVEIEKKNREAKRMWSCVSPSEISFNKYVKKGNEDGNNE